MSNEVFPILIVDDEPNIRTGLARALECESYAIATAGDAGEALRQFRITHHPLVLTDLKMPGASTGIDLIPKMACNIGLMFNPNFFACLGVFHLAIEHVFLAQRHCDCRRAEFAVECHLLDQSLDGVADSPAAGIAGRVAAGAGWPGRTEILRFRRWAWICHLGPLSGASIG